MNHEDSLNVVLGTGRMKLCCPSVMMHCSLQPAKKNPPPPVEKDDLAYHIAFILLLLYYI
jgi:hypothetical protein